MENETVGPAWLSARDLDDLHALESQTGEPNLTWEEDRDGGDFHLSGGDGMVCTHHDNRIVLVADGQRIEPIEGPIETISAAKTYMEKRARIEWRVGVLRNFLWGERAELRQ